MKHKFILSIITTLVTLIIFVTSIFAWMTVNNSVGAGGVNGNTIDVSKIDVEIYNTTNDNGTLKVLGNPQTQLTMPIYENEANDETKIFVKVTIDYKNTLNHKLYLNTINGSIKFYGELVNNTLVDNTIESDLSNTIEIYSASYNETSKVVTIGNKIGTFFNSDYSKNYNIVLGENLTEVNYYFVIDYDKGLFDNIYSSLLSSEFSSGANISTKVKFRSDITFRLEAHDA